MGVNQLYVDDELKFDLTQDTVTPQSVLKDVTFHSADGDLQSGQLVPVLTVNGVTPSSNGNVNVSYKALQDVPVAFTPISHTHSLDDISGVKDVIKLEFGIVPNTYISNSNGSQISYSGWSSTDYVDVHEYEKIETYGVGATSYCALYDSDKKYIRSISLTQDPYEFATNGAYYFRASNSSTNINKCEINGLKSGGGSYFDHFIKDDDVRLTDAREPLPHTHTEYATHTDLNNKQNISTLETDVKNFINKSYIESLFDNAEG